MLCSSLANEMCRCSLTFFSFRVACSFGKLVWLFPLIVEFRSLPRLCLHVCFFPSFLPGIHEPFQTPSFFKPRKFFFLIFKLLLPLHLLFFSFWVYYSHRLPPGSLSSQALYLHERSVFCFLLWVLHHLFPLVFQFSVLSFKNPFPSSREHFLLHLIF